MTQPLKKECQSNYKISFQWKDLNLFVDLAGEFGLKNLNAFTEEIKREISRQKLNP